MFFAAAAETRLETRPHAPHANHVRRRRERERAHAGALVPVGTILRVRVVLRVVVRVADNDRTRGITIATLFNHHVAGREGSGPVAPSRSRARRPASRSHPPPPPRPVRGRVVVPSTHRRSSKRPPGRRFVFARLVVSFVVRFVVSHSQRPASSRAFRRRLDLRAVVHVLRRDSARQGRQERIHRRRTHTTRNRPVTLQGVVPVPVQTRFHEKRELIRGAAEVVKQNARKQNARAPLDPGSPLALP